MSSHDVLERLRDVEAKAEGIVAAAAGEAEARINVARTETESRVKASLEARRGVLESELDKAMMESDETLRQQLSDYRTRLESLPSGGKEFDQICADFLAGRS